MVTSSGGGYQGSSGGGARMVASSGGGYQGSSGGGASSECSYGRRQASLSAVEAANRLEEGIPPGLVLSEAVEVQRDRAGRTCSHLFV